MDQILKGKNLQLGGGGGGWDGGAISFIQWLTVIGKDGKTKTAE